MSELREHTLKRLTMRSWRRGTKEMDLILGPFADARIDSLSGDTLIAFEAMLEENDQDLYQWVTGQVEAPAEHADLLAIVRDFHGIT